MAKRQREDQRKVSHYLRVVDDSTGELVGYLADISSGGFKIDCQKPIAANSELKVRIELTPEVARQFLVFSARSRWCRSDRYDPSSFNVGFKVTNLTPVDMEIFTRMLAAARAVARSS